MSLNESQATPLLTIEEVAHHCKVSKKTVRRWLKRRELVGHLLGGQWRITSRDLDIFIKIRREG